MQLERVSESKLNVRGRSAYALAEGGRLLASGPDLTLKAREAGAADWALVVDAPLPYSALYLLSGALYAVEADERVVVERFDAATLESAGVALQLSETALACALSRRYVALLTARGLLLLNKEDMSSTLVEVGGVAPLFGCSADADTFCLLGDDGKLVQVTVGAQGQPRTAPIDTEAALGGKHAITALCCDAACITVATSEGELYTVATDDSHAARKVAVVPFADRVTFLASTGDGEVAVQHGDSVTIVDTAADSAFSFFHAEPLLSVRSMDGLLYVHDMAGELSVYRLTREQPQTQQAPVAERVPAQVVAAPQKPTPAKSKTRKPKRVQSVAPQQDEHTVSESDEELQRAPRDEPLDVIVRHDEEEKREARNKPKRLLLDEDEEEQRRADDIDFDEVERFAAELADTHIHPQQPQQPEAQEQTHPVEEPRRLMHFERQLAEKAREGAAGRQRGLRYLSDESVGAKLQPAFSPGSYGGPRDATRVLRCNALGAVLLHSLDDGETVAVEYADNSLHRKQLIANRQRFALADLALTGFALASAGSAAADDEYEDETGAPPVLYFRSLRFDDEWSVEFAREDAPRLLALSSQYVLLADVRHVVRVFSHGGAELCAFAAPAPVVCLAAFEHLLTVVTLAGLPLLGCQQLRVHTYDARHMRLLYDAPLAVSPRAHLSWLGYSDDGVLHSQDSAGVVRVLVNRSAWLAVHEGGGERRFWLLAVVDGELLGYRLGAGERAPVAGGRYALHRQAPRVRLHSADGQCGELRERLALEGVRAHLEREKCVNFGALKNSLSDAPRLRAFTQRVLPPADIDALEDAADVGRVECMRALLVHGQRYAALHEATQIRRAANFDVALALLERVKQRKLAEELRALANDSGLFAELHAQAAEYAPPVLTEQPDTRGDEKVRKWVAQQDASDGESKDFFRAERERLQGARAQPDGGARLEQAGAQKPRESKKRVPDSGNLLGDLHSAAEQHKQLKKVNRR